MHCASTMFLVQGGKQLEKSFVLKKGMKWKLAKQVWSDTRGDMGPSKRR